MLNPGKKKRLKSADAGRKVKTAHTPPALQQPTKNRLKRQSLNHQYKALRAQHQDILQTDEDADTNLSIPDWRLDVETEATIKVSIPGTTGKEDQPAVLKTLTHAIIAIAMKPTLPAPEPHVCGWVSRRSHTRWRKWHPHQIC